MIYKASNHPVFDSNVATIQRNLNRLNQMLGGNAWETLVDDGLYGRGTARAVKAFQTLYHLSPDGQYGTDTDAALRTALSDAKTAKNSVPVKASINGANPSKAVSHTRSSSIQATDSMSMVNDEERPTCSINDPCMVGATQQDDFMCSNFCTSTVETAAPTISGKSLFQRIKEILVNTWDNFIRTCGNLKAIVKSGEGISIIYNKLKTEIFSLANTVKTAFQNAYREFWDAYHKVPFDSQKTYVFSEKESKEIMKKMGGIVEETGEKWIDTFKNALFTQSEELTETALKSRIKSLVTGILKHAARPIDLIISFAEVIGLYFDEDRGSAEWQARLESSFQSACDMVIVGIMGEIATAIIVALCIPGLGPLGVCLVGLAVAFVFGVVYFAFAGDNTGCISRWLNRQCEKFEQSELYAYIGKNEERKDRGTKNYSASTRVAVEHKATFGMATM